MKTTEEIAYLKIQKLVDDFKKSENYYLSKDYQESETRKDFIDKFFIALGWDVYHDQQKDPYEQEVKIEKGVNVSGAQKRADYSFAIAPNFRDPKYFVEAKKPVQDLYDEDHYFQTIRYGWHKATPIAVLTNFQEFHILDCRYSPDISTILKRQIKRYHYLEYTDREKFAEIYWLFSREAVVNNSLEKRAEELPKPRGKSVQTSLFPLEKHLAIDDAFLEEIDGIREKIAKALKINDESLNSDELTEASQKTIDRLVFIRFLEDKLIEPVHHINTFGEKGNAWDDFIAICKKLNIKYNGIVFKKSFIDEDKFKGPVDSEFHNICQDICHLNSRFLYNEIPIHILGSIYERFLGKVVHATAKQVKVEEKPEVRRAGGVYYTPKYIVDYIVQNTVGKIIKGKTPEEISKMRFVDIACGSGSFLIGVFDYLLTYYSKYYQQHPNKAKKSGCHYKDGMWVLSIRQKQNILRNNIFGVDIDMQAVEVTQLSLSLKMLEDETTATAKEMHVLFHEKILPDMTKNIVCGNSLVKTDILTRGLFVGEEERKLNPMDFEGAFPEVMRNGGFNVVLGNPPYDVLEKERKQNISPHIILQEYVKEHDEYQPALGGKLNMYRFFVVRAINLLKKNGYFGYIIPLSILADTSCKNAREYLFQKLDYLKADCFPQKDNPQKRVFKEAKLSTVVITGVKKDEIVPNKRNMSVTSYQWNSFLDDHKSAKINYIKLQLIDPENLPIPLVSEEEWNLLIKLHESIGINNLGNVESFIIRRGEINQTIFKEYICDDPQKQRLVKGVEIGRYTLNTKLSQGKIEWLDEHAYLKKNGFKEFVLSKRIATQRITGVDEKIRIVATVIEPPAYFADSTNSIHLAQNSKYNLFYLLGLLNSNLFQWRFKLTSTNNNVGTNELSALPFKEIDFNKKKEISEYEKIIQMVEQILKAKKQLHAVKTDKDKDYYERKCRDMDSLINDSIYRLYSLTEEEIKIISIDN